MTAEGAELFAGDPQAICPDCYDRIWSGPVLRVSTPVNGRRQVYSARPPKVYGYIVEREGTDRRYGLQPGDEFTPRDAPLTGSYPNLNAAKAGLMGLLGIEGR